MYEGSLLPGPPASAPHANAATVGSQRASFIPLLKLTINWRTSYKSLPAVQKFFDSHITPSTIHQILSRDGTTGITIYEATPPKDLSPSLWLSLEQANLLKQAIVDQPNLNVNPSLMKTPFKADFIRRLDQFGSSPPTTVSFKNGAEVDARLGQLKELATEKGLESSRKELEDCRAIWEIINEGRRGDSTSSGAVNGTHGTGGGGGSFFAMDIETWERDHEFLTEVGYSYVIFRANGGGRPGTNQTREDTHVVIQENEKKRNGRFVPDARDHFDFGATTIISESLLADRLATTLNTFSTAPNGPLLLLCHDPRAEITALKMLNIDADAFKTGLGGLLATLRGGGKAEGVWVVDTQDLYRGWRGEKKQEKLENCCSVLQVPTRRLHNAGNDAVYTLMLFEKLMNRSILPPPLGTPLPAPVTRPVPKKESYKAWVPPVAGPAGW